MEPEIKDQTKLTLNIPDETPATEVAEDLNKMADKKKPVKKMENEDKDMDYDKDKDKDKDKEKDKDEDEKSLEKTLEKVISKHLAPINDRLEALEKTGKVTPKTIKKDGFTYVLQKTVDADKKELKDQIEDLKKSTPKITPQQSVQIHNEQSESESEVIITPLQKRAKEISEMSITERMSMASNSNRDRLEKMGVFLQN